MALTTVEDVMWGDDVPVLTPRPPQPASGPEDEPADQPGDDPDDGPGDDAAVEDCLRVDAIAQGRGVL